MSLIESLINQISTKGLGEITSPQGFDLNDDTFAKLLNKQLNLQESVVQNNLVGEMGIPAGLFIEPFDEELYADMAQNQLDFTGYNELSREEYINQPVEFKDIDMGDYFSKMLQNSENSTDFMNFARKHASNLYNQHSRNVITDSTEFVEGILNS